ncbi:hypothetical protein ACO22_06623 [Paracoccidioides brasiliensis]|uniref:Uncharacterized protein n=1 Tax=Paracoccidioides brasiliensis TaxID=121759 RepID=A0A1D2J6Y5_PARBR|nr:hypothetical protein ACO22_06623 [Paracoccidioides brasiliensis]
MGKNEDKDKGGTGSPPVHNIIKQIFCTAEKAYSSGQTGEDTRVLDSDSGAHATPRREIIEIKSQKVTVTLEMAVGVTVPLYGRSCDLKPTTRFFIDVAGDSRTLYNKKGPPYLGVADQWDG